MTELPVRSAEDMSQVQAHLHATSFPFRVIITKALDRTGQQNKTVHKWFGEIAAHRKDMTMLEVKAECNLTYGRPIKDRDDPDWKAVFGYLFDRLNHEKKLLAIRTLDVPFTRDMNTKQLSEYMDQMQRDYLAQGVSLTIPKNKP
jgi:hypothetical protein